MAHHPSKPRSTETLLLILGRRVTRYRLGIQQALVELADSECPSCKRAASALYVLDRPDDAPKT